MIDYPAWQRLLDRIVDEAVEAGVDRKRAVAGVELIADPVGLQRAVYRYNARVWPGGGRCDCPDAAFDKAGRRCKHQCALLTLQRLQRWIRLPAPMETPSMARRKADLAQEIHDALMRGEA